ncbi:MAG: TonB-dependent receptor [Gammaproteobacteria bacterium]|nr:TonB-dependent receptor [Gammaproteobacteria bacterium]MDH5304108.1 TonB-dependent receptor [Gammaproteobacteria bacterium]MDH5322541.1 TonB-dependent receptor [Gammaproteobacteria bacterium]
MNRYVALNSRRFGAVLLPLATAMALASGAALAQQASGEIFEEIVVLATKRAANILDVPVAVSTLSGTQLTEAGIFDMFELQQNVPGLIVGQSQSTTTSNFSIRSIGSTSNNFGVESSVGLYVDGVYRSRQSSMINDLIDIEAVEVLRGPQGTLFGKNTAAGAISVRTVRPSHDRDAFVDVTAGDLGLIKVSAAANVPINDNMALRGTVFSTQRDGYVDDYNLGSDVYNDRDRIGARVQLAINDPEDDFNARIIADYSEIDEVCCVGIVRVDSILYKGALPGILAGAIDVNDAVGSQFVNALVGGTVFATYDYPQALLDGLNAQLAFLSPISRPIVAGASFDDYRTALSSPPISTNEDAGLSMEINKTLGNGVQLKSITAYRSFETYDSIDIDFSDADLIHRVNTGEQSSISQEFQFIGEFGDGSSWVAGAYYFGQDLDSTTNTSAGFFFNDYVSFLRPSIPVLLAGINQLDAGLELAGLGALLNPATIPFPAGAYAFDVVQQDHSGYAVFGQVDYAVNDKLTLSLGARYTDETKDINARYTQTANGPRPDIRACAPDPLDPTGTSFIGGAACVALFEAGAYLQTGGMFGSLDGLIAGDLAGVTEPSVAWGSYLFDPFSPRPDVKDSLSEDQSTGTVKLTLFPTNSTMLYASYATGFKAGGTNTDRINVAFDQLFTAETSESIELGLKGQYGPVQLVLTYYQTDFDDFQANSFTGTGFNLQNAGDLSIDGVEVEFLWRPMQNTEIQAHYTHNEGKYNSFESGTAWDTWVAQVGVWQGEGDPGCTAPFDPANLPTSCPRTGDPLPYNPEDRAFLALSQSFDVGGTNAIVARLEYTYASEQFTDGDNDPFTLQDEVTLINARIGINFGKSNSSLTVWGRNITDERWYSGSADLPVAEDGMFSYPAEPASYGVTYRKSFD